MKLKHKVYFLILLASLLTLTPPSIGQAEMTIEWEIGNRFRAFDYSNGKERDNPEESARLFERFAPKPNTMAGGKKPADLHSWVAQVVREGGSPYAADPGPWVEAPGFTKDTPHYADNFTELPRYIFFKAKISGDDADRNSWLEEDCSWRLNGKEFDRKPCGAAISNAQFPSIGGDVSVWRRDVPIATKNVTPQLKIILGLGDSYASGEGTPDRPTEWSEAFTTTFDDKKWTSLSPREIEHYVKKPATWWSNRCDRSFYSYQNMVALQVAANSKNLVVVFIHLACSGAEIVDGILAPQRRPPGHPVTRCLSKIRYADFYRDAGMPYSPEDRECDVPHSQLAAAAQILCREKPHPAPSQLIKTIKDKLSVLQHGKDENQREWVNEKGLLLCPENQMRPVSIILLSIGGNDIGFSGIIAGALLPVDSSIGIPVAEKVPNWIIAIARKVGGVVCAYARADKPCQGLKLTADMRIKELPQRYTVLGIAMNELLGTNPTNIVINQYPNPLTKMKSENALELCENEDHTDTPNEWRATHLALPTKTAWQINLTKSESLDVQEHDITPLNTEIDAAVDRLNALSKAPLKKRTSQNLQWTTAPLKDVMREHGWCVDRATRMDPLSTPAHEWKPYATTGRFIRTANDSLLTQWPSDERERDRQNGFNGTFHPNAYGYAAMAEEVLKVIPSQ